MLFQVHLSVDLGNVDVVNRRHDTSWVNVSDLRDVASGSTKVYVVNWLPGIPLMIQTSRGHALTSGQVAVSVLLPSFNVNRLVLASAVLAGEVVMSLELNALSRLRLAGTFREGLLLHEHVHSVNPIVVFLETLGFLLGQGKFLVLQVEQSGQVVSVSLQRLVSLL